MSRKIALLAALVICELSVCSTSCMSQDSSSSVPANSESIAEAAEAEQPAKLIEKTPALRGEMKLKAATPKYDEGEKTAATSTKKSSKTAEEQMQDDKEAAANSYMAHDDSGLKVDPLLYYQAGLRFMKAKSYQLALDAFNKALEINPRYYEASYRKAQVYQLTGYDKFAARRYLEVLKYRPDMDEARINLATLHRQHKHYSGAEEQLEAVIQHNWASFEAHYNLANVLVEDSNATGAKDKWERALKEYKFCLKLRPNNANLHNNLGVLFLQKDYPDEALQEFRKAAQLAPKNQMFSTNIAAASKLIAAKKSKTHSM